MQGRCRNCFREGHDGCAITCTGSNIVLLLPPHELSPAYAPCLALGLPRPSHSQLDSLPLTHPCPRTTGSHDSVIRVKGFLCLSLQESTVVHFVLSCFRSAGFCRQPCAAMFTIGDLPCAAARMFISVLSLLFPCRVPSALLPCLCAPQETTLVQLRSRRSELLEACSIEQVEVKARDGHALALPLALPPGMASQPTAGEAGGASGGTGTQQSAEPMAEGGTGTGTGTGTGGGSSSGVGGGAGREEDVPLDYSLLDRRLQQVREGDIEEWRVQGGRCQRTGGGKVGDGRREVREKGGERGIRDRRQNVGLLRG